MEPERLLEAIREVKEGGAPMNSAIARKVVEAFQEPAETGDTLEPLSRREKEILDLLCSGYANKEIADSLHLSIETVRDYLKSIYDKLHVRSRTEAVLKALQAGKGTSLPGSVPTWPRGKTAPDWGDRRIRAVLIECGLSGQGWPCSARAPGFADA